MLVDAVGDPDPVRERLDLAADELGDVGVAEPGPDETGGLLTARLLTEGTRLRDHRDEPGVRREARGQSIPVMGDDGCDEAAPERDAVDGRVCHDRKIGGRRRLSSHAAIRHLVIPIRATCA